jgi:pyruvate formate lyase activating enzyme
MKIKGFQKLTLIDYPGKIACTLFLYGCNFKCGFCHNPELVIKPNLENYSEEDVLNFLDKRKNFLEGVCFTGGEPLMDLNINFVKRLKAMNYLIKIDTNGSFPERLLELIKENLVDYVAMDIKSSKEKYEKITNSRINLNDLEESIRLILELPDYEFRTTIVEREHTPEDIRKMFSWLNSISEKKLKRFVFQGFKNQGKLIDESLSEEKDTNEEYLLKLKKIAEEYCDEVVIRV